jgi:hypothetical protein
MKIKFREENAPLDWWIYENWEMLIHFERSGHRLDDERIAQKLESERGTLSKSVRKYIADRYIRRRPRKRGRRPQSAEEKLRSRRERAVKYVNTIDAALNEVGGDWKRLPKGRLFSGTLQSAKERYSRSKAIKDEWERECLGHMRDAAGYLGITLDEFRADLRKWCRDVP